MKLKFKIQQYQTDAVENVVKVFNGQPNKGLAEYVVDKGKTYVKDNGKLTEVKNIHFEEDSTGYKNGDMTAGQKNPLIHISVYSTSVYPQRCLLSRGKQQKCSKVCCRFVNDILHIWESE